MNSVNDLVVDFYYGLFESLFFEPFRATIPERLKRDAVKRQVQEAAGAASQSLARFLSAGYLDEAEARIMLESYSKLLASLILQDVSNSNRSPEAVAVTLLAKQPASPGAPADDVKDAVFRVGLNAIVQVLMLVGPVMEDWSKIAFSAVYEMPRRVVAKLNQINEQLDALGKHGLAASDEHFELTYRDYLLQRFHRVEAGTVKMTTNLNVDLRELFVMPEIEIKSSPETTASGRSQLETVLMSLGDARKFYASDLAALNRLDEKPLTTLSAWDQVVGSNRNIIIGVPGSGKSTFLEWVQLCVADGTRELVLSDKQAIPVLLRVRELDLLHLPRGAEILEKATASAEYSRIMPPGWLDRAMEQGRILFMLDGLDETEPTLRDQYLIPWLTRLCEEYPRCHYLVSSRPTGYNNGSLCGHGFVECHVRDFSPEQMAEYTRHWCTAVRLARNELAGEARKEGVLDGDRIIDGFKGHAYIRNLARNPLMLSAICLVNYFEGGELPKDRAVLYKLCVEGLLHHWDQRRGIGSDFPLSEKLRVCREIAISMQADERAEYGESSIFEIILAIIKDVGKSQQLLAHMKYRTGLIVERRPGIFAFTHLSFQEYLAACAVLDGNIRCVDSDSLLRDYQDPRWHEVIILYCGLSPAAMSIKFLDGLLACPGSELYGEVLRDSYLSSSGKFSEHTLLYNKILSKIARLPCSRPLILLDSFPLDDVARVVNDMHAGPWGLVVDQAFVWLATHPSSIHADAVLSALEGNRFNPEPHTRLLILLSFSGASHQLVRYIREFSDVGSLALALSCVALCLCSHTLFGLNAMHNPHFNASLVDAVALACFQRSIDMPFNEREIFLDALVALAVLRAQYQIPSSKDSFDMWLFCADKVNAAKNIKYLLLGDVENAGQICKSWIAFSGSALFSAKPASISPEPQPLPGDYP